MSYVVDEYLCEDFFEVLSDLYVTDFEFRLAKAAVENLGVPSPLRLNNFAYSLRELLRHILHRLAPDEDVLLCDWMPVERVRERKIHRRDRIQYIIRGGMSDWAAQNILMVDVNEIANSLLRANQELNSYTHVSESTFNVDLKKTEEMVNDCLGKLIQFAKGIKE